MNTNDNKHCCICLESFEHKSHYTFNFICKVCNEGTMCDECSDEMKGQTCGGVIECPICRSENWKFQFSSDVMEFYLCDHVNLDGGSECHRNPALNFMRKAYHGEEKYNHIDVYIRRSYKDECKFEVELRNLDDSIYLKIDLSFEEE